ncbi:unnamed protein product [Notodromas monacha]|uniref:PWWP domain-containing protein n=1 Tax=Notodromas monacha TaxID=399045 RepID=A0A7R9GBX0_9CRUS|nr:unnamed protein product [Notodromas monacha]CAG0915236.1 unnamed protein product [Notodromas monacha]
MARTKRYARSVISQPIRIQNGNSQSQPKDPLHIGNGAGNSQSQSNGHTRVYDIRPRRNIKSPWRARADRNSISKAAAESSKKSSAAGKDRNPDSEEDEELQESEFVGDFSDEDDEEEGGPRFGRPLGVDRTLIYSGSPLINLRLNKMRIELVPKPQLAPAPCRSRTELFDIVWAKWKNYPFWPGMVCLESDSEMHLKYTNRREVAEIHVQFFDRPVTSAWIVAKLVAPFCLDKKYLFLRKSEKKYANTLSEGVENAVTASHMPRAERKCLLSRTDDNTDIKFFSSVDDDDGHEAHTSNNNNEDEKRLSLSPKSPKVSCRACLREFAFVDPVYGVEMCSQCRVFLETQLASRDKVERKCKRPEVREYCDLRTEEDPCEACLLSAIVSSESKLQRTEYLKLLRRVPNIRVPQKIPPYFFVPDDLKGLLEANGDLHFLHYMPESDVPVLGEEVKIASPKRPSSSPKSSPIVVKEVSEGKGQVMVKNAFRLVDPSTIFVPATPLLPVSAQKRLPNGRFGNASAPPKILDSSISSRERERLITDALVQFGSLRKITLKPSDFGGAKESVINVPKTRSSDSKLVVTKKPRVVLDVKALKEAKTRFTAYFLKPLNRGYLVSMKENLLRYCIEPDVGSVGNVSCALVCPVCLHVTVPNAGSTSFSTFGNQFICGNCSSFMTKQVELAKRDLALLRKDNSDPPEPGVRDVYVCVTGSNACHLGPRTAERCASCWLRYSINAIKDTEKITFSVYRALCFRLPADASLGALPKQVRRMPADRKPGVWVDEDHFGLYLSETPDARKWCCVCCQPTVEGRWNGAALCSECKASNSRRKVIKLWVSKEPEPVSGTCPVCNAEFFRSLPRDNQTKLSFLEHYMCDFCAAFGTEVAKDLETEDKSKISPEFRSFYCHTKGQCPPCLLRRILDCTLDMPLKLLMQYVEKLPRWCWPARTEIVNFDVLIFAKFFPKPPPSPEVSVKRKSTLTNHSPTDVEIVDVSDDDADVEKGVASPAPKVMKRGREGKCEVVDVTSVNFDWRRPRGNWMFKNPSEVERNVDRYFTQVLRAYNNWFKDN